MRGGSAAQRGGRLLLAAALQTAALPIEELESVAQSVEFAGMQAVRNIVEDSVRWAPLACLASWGLMVLKLLHIFVQEYSRYHESGSHARNASFKVYLLYRFGHWYAWTSGSSAIILCCLTASLMVLGAGLHALAAGASLSTSLWASWIWIAAPDGGSSADPGGEYVGILVSVGGMLIFAMLISLVTAEFESTLWHLRHGSIPVVEGGHTVILGWNVTTPLIIEELCNAMESQGGGHIVVMAPLPKPDMEQMFQDAEINLRGSVVVVRSGQPRLKEDCLRVAVQSASRVLVLADQNISHEVADARTLNVLLTLNRILQTPTKMGSESPKRGMCRTEQENSQVNRAHSGASFSQLPHTEDGQSCNTVVVVECCLVRNQRLFLSLACGPMEVMCLQDFVSQLAVEVCRQAGLSHIVSEILGFDGDELYVASVANLKGWRFEDLQDACPTCVPLGFLEEGKVTLAPHGSFVFSGSEQLVLLAEDRSTLPAALPPADKYERRPTRTLPVQGRDKPVDLPPPRKQLVVVLGWNDAVGSMLPELDRLLSKGSEVIIYSPAPSAERQEFLQNSQKRRQYHYSNLELTHIQGPLGARYRLEELPLEQAGKIFILADSQETCASEADAQTVASILQVRDILLERSTAQHLAELVIVPQVLGATAVDACNFSGLTDYVDSTRLSACVLASICANPEICGVLEYLLSSHGARLYIRRIADYIQPEDRNEDVSLSFREVSRLAASCGEIIIGYYSMDGSDRWILNPKDKEQVLEWDVDELLLAAVGLAAEQRNKMRISACQTKLRATLQLTGLRKRKGVYKSGEQVPLSCRSTSPDVGMHINQRSNLKGSAHQLSPTSPLPGIEPQSAAEFADKEGDELRRPASAPLLDERARERFD